jgi:hypothetical protein
MRMMMIDYSLLGVVMIQGLFIATPQKAPLRPIVSPTSTSLSISHSQTDALSVGFSEPWSQA